MSGYLNEFLYGYYPYVAVTVFLLGSLARYDLAPYTWKTGSSQLLRRGQLRLGSNLFHIGILIVFVGHLVGLLTPIAVFDAFGIGHGFKQVMAIVVGGVAGLMCLAGIAILLHRRLTDPRIRRNSSFADNAILILLGVQLLFGLLTIPLSLGHLDGSEMVKFMAWAQRIVTFQGGAAAAIADVSFVFKIHMFLGLTIFLVFPFTRLVHVWSAPVRYILARRGYQIMRTGGGGAVAARETAARLAARRPACG
ncbi:MAG: respiratory nitrate reductase subunit gamma [Rhodospirillaceae bacterium]|nr:respiratory nitrate reductase subunit gamma [Rhodospirillaceae bacterium]